MNQSVLVEFIVESVLDLDGNAVTGLIGSAVEQNLDSVDPNFVLKADHSPRLSRWIVVQREQFWIYRDLATVLDGGPSVKLGKPGEGFEHRETFIPELTMSAEIVRSSPREPEPHVKTDTLSTKRFLIGAVAGDAHDTGKNIGVIFGSGSDQRAGPEDLGLPQTRSSSWEIH